MSDAKNKAPQVKMRALTSFMRGGVRIARGKPFECGAQEARDRVRLGQAERAPAPVAAPAAPAADPAPAKAAK